MLLQTNSYIVPAERRSEHARLIRRFRQTLSRIGCDQFEVYEQVGANWSPGASGRYVQIMRFRDRQHQQAVQNAERNDPGSQRIIAEFCELINFPYQQQQGFFATSFYQSVIPVGPRPVEYLDDNSGESFAGEEELVSEAGEGEAEELIEGEMVEGAAEEVAAEDPDLEPSGDAEDWETTGAEELTGAAEATTEEEAGALDELTEAQDLTADAELAPEEELVSEEEAAAEAELTPEEELTSEEELSAEGTPAPEEELAANGEAVAEGEPASEEELAAEAELSPEEVLVAEEELASEEELAAESELASEEESAIEEEAAAEEELAPEEELAAEADVLADGTALEEEVASEEQLAAEGETTAEAAIEEEETVARPLTLEEGIAAGELQPADVEDVAAPQGEELLSEVTTEVQASHPRHASAPLPGESWFEEQPADEVAEDAAAAADVENSTLASFIDSLTEEDLQADESVAQGDLNARGDRVARAGLPEANFGEAAIPAQNPDDLVTADEFSPAPTEEELAAEGEALPLSAEDEAALLQSEGELAPLEEGGDSLVDRLGGLEAENLTDDPSADRAALLHDEFDPELESSDDLGLLFDAEQAERQAGAAVARRGEHPPHVQFESLLRELEKPSSDASRRSH